MRSHPADDLAIFLRLTCDTVADGIDGRSEESTGVVSVALT